MDRDPFLRPWRRLVVLAALLVGPLASAAPVRFEVPAGWRQGPPPAAIAKPATAAPGGAKSAADPTDPAIVAKAAALGNDPARIFAFVRDEVGVDPYAGSLRGARGTLATGSANPLDRASLLAALLRAAGFTARYAQGDLDFATAQRILARAFPESARVVGCNNPGGSNGPGDANLVTVLQAHTWVQYRPGAGAPLVDLDPASARRAPARPSRRSARASMNCPRRSSTACGCGCSRSRSRRRPRCTASVSAAPPCWTSRSMPTSW